MADPGAFGRRRVVVPVNATTRSERALPIGARLARVMNVPLALLSVSSGDADRAAYHDDLLRSYRDVDAESIIVAAGGSVAGAFASMCSPHDIVCLGVDHTGAVSELLVGSVFFELVRLFHGPIVAVGPHATVPDGASRVLICLDGTAHAERGLDLIESFADPAHLQPFLIQAIGSSRREREHAADPDVAETSYLHGVAAAILGRDHARRVDVGWDVLHGDAVHAIAATSNEADVAFVGIATDALNPLTRMVSPSLANELLRLSARPLVLLSATTRIVRHEVFPRQGADPVASG